MSEEFGGHQRALAEAVREVLALVAVPATAADPDSGSPAPAANEVCALDALCACFGLSTFERDVLVLAAAAELDSRTAAACEQASGRPYPTFALALARLREPHWSALTPVAVLRRWRLVSLAPDATLTTAALRIDERVLHFLTGVPYLDVRLHGLARPVEPTGETAPSHERVARALADAWDNGARGVVELSGADPQTRREVAAFAAAGLGLRVYAMNGGDVPAEPDEREALARLWEREALLLPAALLVEGGGALGVSLAESLGVPVVLSVADPLPAEVAVGERLVVPALTPTEQHRLWQDALDGLDPDPDQLGRLVSQFSLSGPVIRAAGAAARRAANGNGGCDAAELAWRAGLVEARMALDALGQRIEPAAGWHDLVLPAAQRAVLDAMVGHVRRRATVYEEWGFRGVLRRGLGVTALFAGGSGTGKTLAAEVVAGALGLDLFVIDLSQVVSKYIGETEKNLRRVFDAAERGGAVLLFDEADALFGKRGEVKDSHDRYANIEVSYLLMRMEAYRGLAILTTNMKKALDTAFLRRLRFVVDFPFPGPVERAEIWRRVIPDRAPVRDLDPVRLAQLTVAGGSIRNIALAGAFLAADEGSPLEMRHLRDAARTEYLKLERSLSAAEVSGW